MKTKIIDMSYNAMFKAVFSNNKYILHKLVEAILDYYNLDIDISDKELIIEKNELDLYNYQDKQLICDYIIKIDDHTDLNIEINRSSYNGLSERNLTYSFKIYCNHFKSGDSYDKFNKYTMLQVNLNNFKNPNDKTINKYYMIDLDDIGNRLTSNFSIMNIDIAKCYELVYNKSDLEEISVLEAFGGIIACTYLEDVSFILERGIINMSKKEKEKFLNDIKEKSQDKNIEEAVKLERTIEDRYKIIESFTRDKTTKEVTEKVTKEVTEKVTKEVTTDIIKKFLKIGVSTEIISKSTGYSTNEIEAIKKDI